MANHPGVRGYDAGKKIRGRKRHLVVDTLGLILGIAVTAADVSDRAGALAVLPPVLRTQPRLEHLWADAGYAGGTLGEALRTHAAHPALRLDIIKRSDPAPKGFAVQPRRWVGRTHLRLAHASPPPRPRLRNQTLFQPGHDPHPSLKDHAPQTRKLCQMTFYTVSQIAPVPTMANPMGSFICARQLHGRAANALRDCVKSHLASLRSMILEAWARIMASLEAGLVS